MTPLWRQSDWRDESTDVISAVVFAAALSIWVASIWHPLLPSDHVEPRDRPEMVVRVR